jgi:hypothetical protein
VARATAESEDGWTVQFVRADGRRSLQGGFRTRGDAEYYGQCLWAGPQGRGITEVGVRAHPRDAWQPVQAASVCGGVRL